MLARAGGQHYLSTAYRHSGRAEAAVKEMRKKLPVVLNRCSLSPQHWGFAARWVSVDDLQWSPDTRDLPAASCNTKIGALAIVKLKSPAAKKAKVEAQRTHVMVLSCDRGTAESVRVAFRVAGDEHLHYTSVSRARSGITRMRGWR